MDGIILIDKPKGMTSRDVVNIVCKKLNTKKAGHTGTLDPNATGILAICVGKATKIVDYLTNKNKVYIAEITLGVETATLDPEGKIIKEETVNKISKRKIQETLKSFIGEIKQQVPAYSAVKVNGKKLYEYARNNQDVELPIRTITVNNLDLISDIKKKNGRILFEIICDVSKGTYIRSLVRDIAYKLDTIGIMSNLRRIKQGNFRIEDCNSIENIERILSIKEALDEMNKIDIDNELTKKIKNGSILANSGEKTPILFINNNIPVAIYDVYSKDKNKIKPKIVF